MAFTGNPPSFFFLVMRSSEIAPIISEPFSKAAVLV
jgi:hypothetical protein